MMTPISPSGLFLRIILSANEYRVVFATARDTPDAAGNLHTNFSLSASGEYLALVAPDGTTIVQEFAPGYPPQKTNVSYSAAGFLSLPTPGASNTGVAQQDFVRDTSFDIDRGHYTTPFSITITTNTPEAQIYYTTDGTIIAGQWNSCRPGPDQHHHCPARRHSRITSSPQTSPQATSS